MTPRTPLAVDSGPIVALLNARDRYHDWARTALAGLAPPLLTCEPVLAEACHLLRRLDGGSNAVLSLVRNGAIEIRFDLAANLEAVSARMKRYASVPMSLADACLVRMAETDGRMRIVTLDSDFRIFRRKGRLGLNVITPA